MSDTGERKSIGKLPPTLQGIALDLKLGQETAITTDEHFSAGHGQHYDIYAMKRVSESEVYLFKFHSNDDDTGNWVMDEHRKGLAAGASYRPLSGADISVFSRPKATGTGGC